MVSRPFLIFKNMIMKKNIAFMTLLALCILYPLESIAQIFGGTINIKKGEQYFVDVDTKYSYQQGTWKKDNSTFRIVSSNGRHCTIEGLNVGTGRLDYSGVYGTNIYNLYWTVNVTSPDPGPDKVKVTSIVLSETSIELNAGDTKQLSATIYPSNATNKSVSWSSSNSSVATVSGGSVKAVGEGTATITCSATDGSGVNATCTVTVSELRDGHSYLTKTVEGAEICIAVHSVSSGECEVYMNPGIHEKIQGKITIPSEFRGLKVTKIGYWAFKSCAGITEVVLPSTVKEIDSEAFHLCTSLTNVDLGNEVTKIDDYAFAGCPYLTSVTGYSKLESLGSGVFTSSLYVSNPDEIPWIKTFPEGLLYLGKVLLAYRGTMPANTVINVKEGTTQICYSAFEKCKSLVGITIPQSVTEIGSSAFRNCSGLTSVIIPQSVKRIRDYAFYGCSGLTSVTIPQNVVSISSGAFLDCNISSITIPSSVTYIGEYAFGGCSDLSSITVASGNQKYDSRNNCNAIIETEKNAIIAGCKNTTIPSSVKVIGRDAFYGSSPSTVVITNNIDSVAASAFYKCPSLTSLVIGKGVRVLGTTTSIWSDGKTSYTYSPPIYDCPNLTSISIAQNNPNYDSRDDCNAIIETSTNKLISACVGTVIPSTVKSIGTSSFSKLPLSTITIPDNVEIIDRFAFSMTDLHTVTIGKNIKEIGDNAFSNCYNLSAVYSLNENPINVDESVFANKTYNNATLYVPVGSKFDYMTTPGWSRFQKIVEFDPSEVKSIKTNADSLEPVFSLSGQRITTPRKGINIVGGKKVIVK